MAVSYQMFFFFDCLTTPLNKIQSTHKFISIIDCEIHRKNAIFLINLIFSISTKYLTHFFVFAKIIHKQQHSM